MNPQLSNGDGQPQPGLRAVDGQPRYGLKMGRMRALAVVAVLASACGRPEPPPLAARGEVVNVHIRGEVPAALVAFYDDAARILATELGIVAIPEINVFVYQDVGDVQVICVLPERDGLQRVGCAFDNEVHQNTLFHAHELVHAVLRDTPGSSRALAEGIAEVYSCDPRSVEGDLGAEVWPDEDLRIWLQDDAGFADGVRVERYAQAASFVAYLLDQSPGPEGFLRVYQGQSYSDVYARDVEAIVDEWVAAGPRRFGDICRFAIECGQEPVVRLGESVELETQRGLLPLAFPGSMARAAYAGAVEIPDDGLVSLSLLKSAGPGTWAEAYLVPCDVPAPDTRRSTAVPALVEGWQHVQPQRAGHYALYVYERDDSSDERAALTVQLDSILESTVGGESCSTWNVDMDSRVAGVTFSLDAPDVPRPSEYLLRARRTDGSPRDARFFVPPGPLTADVERIERCDCAGACSPLLDSSLEPTPIAERPPLRLSGAWSEIVRVTPPREPNVTTSAGMYVYLAD